jgi:hypothetical protein
MMKKRTGAQTKSST